MNQQRGFTLLEMMLVLALVAITASVVLFTYGREDVANTRARETAARFTAALELAIDRATLSGQPVGIHFSDSAWRIMVPGKTPSAWRWVPLQEDAADESQNDWDEELSIHLQPFKPDDSNQPQVVILADGQITPFSLLMANAGTGEPLLTLVCSGSWPLESNARQRYPPMNKQSGMTLLEVLLAMSIFTAVALTLMSSMQGQRNAIERMRNETLALWIADNQLQSQDSFGEENTSSSGKELINGEEWNWRSDIHSSKDGTLLERTITVTLPSGQTTSLTRYQSIDNKSGQAQDD
ncbi:general secretion pathway protein H [Escherichia coli]|nr:general secretion pathway protein H [Escherichia coli]